MIQYVAHKVAKHMATPVVGWWNRLKRASRFLQGSPRWVQRFMMQDPANKVEINTDSCWAADLNDRKTFLVFYAD